MRGEALGRYGETALWVVVALVHGPRTLVGLLDAVRDLDGRIGPGRLLGAVARLERLRLIEPAPTGADQRTYRLAAAVLPGTLSTRNIRHRTEVPPA